MTDAYGEGILRREHPGSEAGALPACSGLWVGWSQGAGEAGLEGETGERTEVRAKGDPMRGWEGQA